MAGSFFRNGWPFWNKSALQMFLAGNIAAQGRAAMSDLRPTFSVQSLDYRPGYVVVATWPDGKSEQPIGIYIGREQAEQWIRGRSALWLASRGH
jgi:hypothetical protein